MIILNPILKDKRNNKLRDEILIILLSCFALCILTLTISGTSALVKKWFRSKRSEMCIATFRRANDKSDQQPLNTEIDLNAMFWNRDSVFSEFSYFEPIRKSEAMEMTYIDGSRVYV